jgi:triacylglycerol esterase/lipase EstA (alpha/beta hydrolase family)
MTDPISDYPLAAEPQGPRIAKEALALVGLGVLYPLGLYRPRTRTPRRKEQRTIVMVHGLGANHATLLPLAAYLRLRHRDTAVLFFNYASGDGIAAAALALKRYLRAHVRGGRVDLVCHSLGGVVSRFYLQELGGARRVDRCITLATPHRGTYNAYWLPSRIGRELRPDSRLLATLEAGRSKAARVHFTSIVAGSDTIVVPRVFADHERVRYFADLGHAGLLFSPRVFNVVSGALNET